MSQPVRVRFAPSPTGNLHIGGARTALFNWAYARRFGGSFLLRIEDTDPERSTKAYEAAILEGLSWLGIHWDEGPDIGGPYAPYRQSERYPRYREVAEGLLASGQAYYCFCSADRLDQVRAQQEAAKQRQSYDRRCASVSREEASRRRAAGEACVIRARTPEGKTAFHDHIRGDVEFTNEEVEDWVMIRTDGSPTYNFCVVCDDVDMRITHVFRGEEHLVNTPKQVLLYRALGLTPPEFGHLPLMLGSDGKKLSKRTGDTALQDYREAGYPREAVVNFLCLQGWALDGSTELFSVDQLVAHFDIKDVQKAGAIFDLEKFRWMAGEYIRRDTLEHVGDMCAPFVIAGGLTTAADLQTRRAWFLDAVKSERERIHTYAELAPRVAYLFAGDDEVVFAADAQEAARKHVGATATLRDYAVWLAPRFTETATAAELRDASKAWVAERKLKMPAFYQPLRCALMGSVHGTDVFDVLLLLGRERALARIEHGARRLGV